jgi:hypothetical protein
VSVIRVFPNKRLLFFIIARRPNTPNIVPIGNANKNIIDDRKLIISPQTGRAKQAYMLRQK